MVHISNISAIATLIAFIILITGKIILVVSRKNSLINEFSFDYLVAEQWNEIYDEWPIDADNLYNGEMCVRSAMGLRKLSVYRINEEDGTPLPSPILISEYKNLPANQLLKIHIRVPEGFPLYRITATRDDYVILEKEVFCNASGLQKYNYAHGKFTFRSYLFYIFS